MSVRDNWDTPEEARAFKQVMRDDPDLYDSYENRIFYGGPLFLAGLLVAWTGYELYSAGFNTTFLKLAGIVLGALWLVAIVIFLRYCYKVTTEIDRRKAQYIDNPYLRER